MSDHKNSLFRHISSILIAILNGCGLIILLVDSSGVSVSEMKALKFKMDLKFCLQGIVNNKILNFQDKRESLSTSFQLNLPHWNDIYINKSGV